jgi:hypothetical protein
MRNGKLRRLVPDCASDARRTRSNGIRPNAERDAGRSPARISETLEWLRKLQATPGAGIGSWSCCKTSATASAICCARPVSRWSAYSRWRWGIGADTAIFSVVDSVLFRALPYRDARRLAWATNSSQRTREMGVRVALGAGRGNVLRMILNQGFHLALIGVGLGLAASFALTRLMTGLLFGVKPSDPQTFILVTAALLAVALAACWIPAHRATRVDPVVAFRHE